MSPLDLRQPLRIHVIGVGGAGMRSIASVLVAMGHTVSGSDLKYSPGLDRLAAEGVTVMVGHEGGNVGEVDVVTRSTAVPDTNAEIRAAREREIPVLSRAEILSAITRVRPTVAVAGTHGKTTTSSMLAVILREANFDPSFIIGGEVNEIGSGAAWTVDGRWFVVEADESDGTFLALDAAAAIVTSVEPDHLGHYGGSAALTSAFEAFVDGVGEVSVICVDDVGAAALADRPGVITYGVDPDADWQIVDYRSGRASARFDLIDPGDRRTHVELATPGLHNVRNATAAIVMGHHLGVEVGVAAVALARFGGVARRFHFRGERNGVSYVDDYAHLPTEVSAALEAAAAGEWHRVVCVFQPHRYSRTSDLWEAFGGSFTDADLVVVTDIYAAGEAPLPGVSGKLVADAVRAAHPDTELSYIPHRAELRTYLAARLEPGDLCLTLGAGDLTTLADEMLSM